MGQQKTINCPVERLTNGPKHHLFGFHDLIVSNPADDKYLCLEVDTINRPPLAGETFGVGYAKDGLFVKLGETTALNYPQGARQQWMPGSERFTVNNRVGNLWGTDLYDASDGKKIASFPATTHMLSKDGRFAYGLDYARLFRLGVYGYSGLADASADEMTPEKSGITVMDMQSGEVKMLVSVKEVANFGYDKVPLYGDHYLTHLCVSPDSKRIAFLHRFPMADGGEMTRLMTIGADGSGLRCLCRGFLSHFDWKDSNTLYIFGRPNSSVEGLRNSPLMNNPLMKFALGCAKDVVRLFIGKGKSIVANANSFHLVVDSDNPEITAFAKDIIPVDGHPMTCPADSNLCSLDTYPDGEKCRDLFIYDFKQDLRINLGRFRMSDEQPDMSLVNDYFNGVDASIVKRISSKSLSFTRSGLHCDLHPRWNSKGNRIVFDSIHEGSRQMYCVDVHGLV